MNNYLFQEPVRVHFGSDVFENLTQCLAGLPLRIVADPIIRSMASFELFVQKMGIESSNIFFDVEPNPSCDTINRCLKQFHGLIGKDAVLIGIGGGSALDTAKAVSVLLGTSTTAEELFYGRNEKPVKRVRLILVPTTSGTGSEVTNVSVLQDLATGIKKPIVDDAFYADDAWIDPALTTTMPAGVTASTGWDAFCHSLEAYWSVRSNPISDQLALESMRLVYENVITAYEQPTDILARERMSLASLLAGMAFNQTRTTLIHAIAYPLTARWHIAHGRACATMILPVLNWNAPVLAEKIALLRNRLSLSSFQELQAGITMRLKKTGIETRLGQYGVKEIDLDAMVDEVLPMNLTTFNPRKIDNVQLKNLLQQSI